MEEVNKNDRFRCTVKYVGLFGSLGKGAAEVGDIDIVVKLGPKTNEGIGISHFLEVIKFIKNKNPYVNIHEEDEDELKNLNIFPKQLFPCA